MASGTTGKKLECKDLHGYLKTLPHHILDKLYNHPATCLAVFRYVLYYYVLSQSQI
jgi:transcription initiation factor TFIIH subunit 4